MRRTDNAETKRPEKHAILRLVLWSVWLTSGLFVLILLAAIVATLMEKPSDSVSDIQQRTGLDTSTPYREVSQREKDTMNDEVKDIIKQIHNRKGYSNPTRTLAEEEDDEPEKVVTRKPRTRRPLKLIGKDFDPNKSFIIKHPNGTLTYVFPRDTSSNTIMSTTPSTIEPPAVTEPFAQARSLYPDDLINEIMTLNNATFQGVFGDDVVIPDGDALNSRSDTANAPFLCESEQLLIHPKEELSRNNSMVWIVNTKDYKQGVRIEKCLKRQLGKPCNFCDADTECKQLFHYRTLVAVDKVTKKPYKEQVLLPSCCKCAKILS